MNAIAEAAIAKTIADEEIKKKSTQTQSPPVGEKEGKRNEIPKIKNVGFVNYKWTEILVEDDEESEEIDRNKVKKAIIQMMKREEDNIYR